MYAPFDDPSVRVVRVLPESGVTLASAAKIPILAKFEVERQQGGEEAGREGSAGGVEELGLIFKEGDDCRQDVLALQVIAVLRDVFRLAEVGARLVPYGVIATGYEKGIIELVPHSQSRSGLALRADGGLLQIFTKMFGTPGSPDFEQARKEFVKSCAGYAVASYLLNAKDRHNGNLLIQADGALVHIDFGFILTISPGGNLGFETAGFKLSHEMAQLLDPEGNQRSPDFLEFTELAIKGFLAARKVTAALVGLVAQMERSGLPCFGYGKPVEGLVGRLVPELSEEQAAAHFARVVRGAYRSVTTGVYDVIQYLQQGIPK